MNILEQPKLYNEEEAEPLLPPFSSLFNIHTPEIVDPLEGSASLFKSTPDQPMVVFQDVTPESARANLNKNVDPILEHQSKLFKEKQSIQQAAVESGMDKDAASKFSEVQQFNKLVNEERKDPKVLAQELSDYDNSVVSGLTDALLLNSGNNEDATSLTESISSLKKTFEGVTKKFVATPNGLVTPFSIVSEVKLKTWDQHKAQKSNYYYLLTNSQVRDSFLEALDEESYWYKTVKSLTDSYSTEQLSLGDFGDDNYFSRQDQMNGLINNVAPYAFELIGTILGKAGITATSLGAKAAAMGGLASAGFTVGAWLAPAMLAMGVVGAYMAYQNDEVNKATSEYYKMVDKVNNGELSYEQLKAAYDKNIKTEFFNKNGSLNVAAFNNAVSNGVDTSIISGWFPSDTLSKTLGKSGGLTNTPRDFKYDMYMFTGDVMGESLWSSVITVPLRLGALWGSAKGAGMKAVIGASTFGRSVASNLLFDVAQGFTMQAAYSTETIPQLLNSIHNAEYSLGTVGSPIAQMVLNILPKQLSNKLGSKFASKMTNSLLLEKVGKEFFDNLNILKFSAVSDTLFKVGDSKQLIEDTIKQEGVSFKATNWAEAMYMSNNFDMFAKLNDPNYRAIMKERFIDMRNSIQEDIEITAKVLDYIGKENVDGKYDYAIKKVEDFKNLIGQVTTKSGDPIDLFEDKTFGKDRFKYILLSILDDSKLLDSSIEKYVDESGKEQVGFFRNIVITNIPGLGDTTLRFKVEIDDIVDLYKAFIPRASGDTKISQRVDSLKNFKSELGSLLLRQEPITDIKDLPLKDGGTLKILINEKQLPLDYLESLRADFSTPGKAKYIGALNQILTSDDFESFLHHSFLAGSVGFTNTTLMKELSFIVGKLSNVLSSSNNGSLVSRFFAPNVENKASISGAFLEELSEIYFRSINSVEKLANSDALDVESRNLLSFARSTLEDVSAVHAKSKDSDKIKVTEDIISAISSKLSSKELLSINEVKEIVSTAISLVSEVGYTSEYKGILSDLLRVSAVKGKEADTVTVMNKFINPQNNEAGSKEYFKTIDDFLLNMLIDDSLPKKVMTELEAIKASGFGGLYASLKAIDSNFADINAISYLKIKHMLGFSTNTSYTTVSKILNSSQSKLEKLAGIVTKGMGNTPSKEEVYKHYFFDESLSEKFTFDSLEKFLYEAAIAKKIGFQLKLELERTRSTITGPSLKSIGSAMTKLAHLMGRLDKENDNQSLHKEVQDAEEAVRIALFNSGIISEKVIEKIMEYQRALLDKEGRLAKGSDETAFSFLDNLIRISDENVANPALKFMSQDSLFLEDLSKIMGLHNISGNELRSRISNYFKLDEKEPGAFFAKLKSGISGGTKSFMGSPALVGFVEDTPGGVISAEYAARMNFWKTQLFKVIDSVLGKEDSEALEKAMLQVSSSIAESGDKKNTRFLNYENMYRDFEDNVKKFIYDINKTSTGNERSIFFFNEEAKASDQGWFTRKIKPSLKAVENVSKISEASKQLIDTFVDKIFNRLAKEGNDIAVDKVGIALERMLTKEMFDSEVVPVIKNNDMEAIKKIEILSDIFKKNVEERVERAVLINSLSSMGFGDTSDSSVTYMSAARSVAEKTRNTSVYQVVPHLNIIRGMLDTTKSAAAEMSKLTNASKESVNASVSNIKMLFDDVKSLVSRFKEHGVLNTFTDEIQMRLYRALDSSIAKTEQMVKNFDETFNAKDISEVDRKYLVSVSSEYFNSAFGWVDGLTRVLTTFVDNIKGASDRQNGFLFDEDIVDALQRSFGTLDKSTLTTLSTSSSKAEMLLSDNSMLSKTSTQVKKIWNAISQSSLYNKTFKRNVIDPYYGLSQDFTLNMKKFYTDRDNIQNHLGTIAQRLGLNAKEPRTVREFGRNVSNLLTFTTGELPNIAAITAFNTLIGKGKLILSKDNLTPDNLLTARAMVINKILNVTPGRTTDEVDIVAKDIASYLNVFEKHGIMDLVLEHSAEFCVSRDKLNSYSEDPKLSDEKNRMLKTWDEKLMKKIVDKYGVKEGQAKLEEIKQDIRNTIAPEANIEDALVFNSLIVNDFTGKLLIGAAIDDDLLRYTGALVPKLHEGAIQLRGLIDYTSTLGMRYGELGFTELDNLGRGQVASKLFALDNMRMDKIVNNPIHVEGVKFHIKSYLQQTLGDFERSVKTMLRANEDLASSTFNSISKKEATYYIAINDIEEGIKGGKGGNVYLSVDLGENADLSAMQIASRAVFGSTSPDSKFIYVQAGNNKNTGLKATKTDDGAIIELRNSEKDKGITMFTPEEKSQKLSEIFKDKKLVVAFRNDLSSIVSDIRSKLKERLSTSNNSLALEVFNKVNTKKTSAEFLKALGKLAASEDPIERQVYEEFSNLFSAHNTSRLANEIVLDLNGEKFRIFGASIQIQNKTPDKVTSTTKVDTSKIKNPIYQKEIENRGGDTPGPTEKSTLQQINNALWGTVEATEFSTKKQPRTLTIFGSEIKDVVRVMSYGEIGKSDGEVRTSSKPDLVIETLTGDRYFVSCKSEDADIIDSSSFLLNEAMSKSALVNALMGHVQTLLNESNKTSAEAAGTLKENSFYIQSILGDAVVKEGLNNIARQTSALIRGFGGTISAEDIQTGAGDYYAPFSKQGIAMFVRDLNTALESVIKANNWGDRPFSELFADEKFTDAIWTHIKNINPWLKAITEVDGNSPKFTELTKKFMTNTFLGKDGTSDKGIVQVLKSIGNMEDIKKKRKENRGESDGEDTVSNIINKYINNSYAVQRAEIGNLDKSLTQMLALKPDIFNNIKEGISNLVQRIQLGTFINKTLMNSGALRYIGTDRPIDQDDIDASEKNGLVKQVTLGQLSNELKYVFPDFIKLIMKSDQFQSDFLSSIFKDVRNRARARGQGENQNLILSTTLENYYKKVRAISSGVEGTDLGSIKLVLASDLYEQLSFLNEKLTPKQSGNTFGSQMLDGMNNIMTYFTTNFSGMVLIWNHISWMRNIMGSILQTALSTGDFFTGMEYTLRAIREITAYSNGKDSGRYGQFLRDNRPSPLTMGRAGVVAHTIDMSTLDRERHNMFKVANTIINKPMEILNKGLYKGLGAILRTDPTSLEASLRSTYGSVDNFNRYALWLMAKDGKVRAPEDYSSLSKLISNDWSLKRSVEKAFSSDVVDRISSNGKFLAPMTDEDASAFSRKFSFVYDELPDWWKLVKAFYNPFASFTYNSYRILSNSMSTYPARVAGLYLTLNILNNAVLKDTLGVDVDLHNFIPNMDVFEWLYGDSQNMDFVNLSNPSAPFLRFARMVMEQRDPYTSQDLSAFGSAELVLRSYINSFFPIAPTPNFVARTGLEIGKTILGIEESPFAETGKLGMLLSLIPESYAYKKFVDEGIKGRPIDKYGTVVNPLAGLLYATFGLNVRPKERVKSAMIIDEWEKRDKSLKTQIENLSKTPRLTTNRDVQMRIRELEKQRDANAQRAVQHFHNVYGEVPEYIKDTFLYNHPLGQVEAVKDYITEVWRSALSNIFEEYGRGAYTSVLSR